MFPPLLTVLLCILLPYPFLCFLIWRVGVIAEPPLGLAVRIISDNPRKALDAWPFSQFSINVLCFVNLYYVPDSLSHHWRHRSDTTFALC